MSEGHQQGIEVSPEEERFLRRTFRRFAVPYLLLMIAICAGVVAWSSSRPQVAEDGSDELASLVAESASLREAIASLRQALDEQATRSAERLGDLEGGLDKLRSARAGESRSSDELSSRLDHAHQRINALEGRLREMEARQVARPAPDPDPAPTGPAAPDRSWPPSGTLDRP